MLIKKKIIIIICIASLVGFVFVLGVSNNIKGKKVNTIFSNVGTEQKLIEENVKKYQPQKTDGTKDTGLDISALSAIVVDENTNKVIYQKDPNLSLPPASITKIATLSVALENIGKDDLVLISQKASDEVSNKIAMKAGEKMHLYDLLYGLMMISANDAAYAIAEAVPGGFGEFINKMNTKVRMLGLTNTTFKNPSGLDEEGHLSSAFDIATLTRYALLEHPEVITYAGEKEDYSVYPSDHNESHWWGHISGMLYRYPGMIAAKTGYTDIAKSTFIGVTERDGRKLVVVILGSSDANGDVTKLLDYGYAN
jgi:D-alanyl-D-alanine carboxypeptidase (penicillin-binding protein 5/6)